MIQRSARGASIEDRIMAATSVSHTGCWVWRNYRDRWGYGRIKVAGKWCYAHRVSYAEFFCAIPEYLTIDHLCKNPACVNPAHLEAVTIAENLRRGTSPSARNARKTHCKNGHELTGENLYIIPGRGARQCRRCNADAAARYKARREA